MTSGQKKKIIFGIIIICISLILVEGISQVWWFQIENCDFEKSDIYSGVNWEMKKQVCVESFQFKTSESVNFQEGYKQVGGLSIPIEKSENTYRIFTLGGGISEGYDSSNKSIPQILEEKFNNFNLNIEIFNVSNSNSWSRVEVNLIKSNLLELEPDLFVIYNGHIDASTHGEWVEPILKNELWDSSKDNSKKVIQDWVDRWDNICQIGNEENFDVLIAIQPMLGSSDREISENEIEFFEEITPQNYLKRLEMYSNALSQLEDNCTETVDLRHSFDGINQQVYYTKGHLVSLGKNIIATKLYENILPIISDSFPNLKEMNFQEVESDESLLKNENFQTVKKSILKFYKSPYMIYHLFSSEKIVEENNEKIDKDKNSNLFFINLRDENLENFNFEDIEILSVDFQDANLQNTNFLGKDLRRSFFMSADISNSNFQFTYVESQYFKDANFIGADFSNSVFTSNGNLSNQDFTNVNFSNSVLLKNNLSNSILTGTNFTNAVLTNVNFKNSNLEDAIGSPFIGCKNHVLCE